jgi:hypothetical protein
MSLSLGKGQPPEACFKKPFLADFRAGTYFDGMSTALGSTTRLRTAPSPRRKSTAIRPCLLMTLAFLPARIHTEDLWQWKRRY